MIDDATVFRLGQDNFRFVGGDDYDGVWLKEQAERRGLKVWVKPSTDQLHNVAVQGPASRDIARPRSSGRRPRSPRSPSSGGSGSWSGACRRPTASRSSCRGPATRASSATRSGAIPTTPTRVWDAVWEAGEPRGLTPFGLDALDIVRIEAGLVVSGNEFDQQVDPFEAGIGFTVDLRGDEDFVGRAALEERRAHPQRALVGLRARRQRGGRPRRPGVRRAPADRRGHLGHAVAGPEDDDRARAGRGGLLGARNRARGRQARRPAEADPRPPSSASRSTTPRRPDRGRDRCALVERFTDEQVDVLPPRRVPDRRGGLDLRRRRSSVCASGTCRCSTASTRPGSGPTRSTGSRAAIPRTGRGSSATRGSPTR